MTEVYSHRHLTTARPESRNCNKLPILLHSQNWTNPKQTT